MDVEGPSLAIDGTLSFGSPEIQQCPFAAYDELRVKAPVYKDPLTGNYVLTRYEDVRKVTLDVTTFSSRNGLGANRVNEADGEVERIYDAKGWRPMDTLISNDPPEHRVYRRLVDRAFTPSKIEELEPRIEQIIHGLIDRIENSSEIDFLADFAIELPMIVIAEQLGVDSRDMDRFKFWSDVSVESQDPTMTFEREIEVANIITEMQQYMAAAIERVRSEPDGMLLSRLVHAEVEGRRLEIRELLSILQQLIVAGNETTTTTLAAGMKLLIENPELVPRLREDPSKIRQFVEETLRVASPIQTLHRKVTQDVEIHGVKLPAGSLVEVRFGAANRDPGHYACPATVDLDRANAATHMAFGVGRHMCIGNQLARAELRLAFKALLNRLEDFRASRGESSYAFTKLYIAYGPTVLWMNFRKRG